MSDIAIKVENISKKYQIGENKNFPTLRDKLMELPNRLFKGPKKNKEFWALKDVSFEVKKGEVVGIIGRNGAGKSTMLKILARITEPTSGKITMYGRVASMLEVGTGFNPELTGRENIYLNGAIIGMTKKEINQKFNDIVEFSGVDKFLDTPVKHYSSGMYVRLAFAVSAHLDADILLIDEVLAVGDAEFQKKCLDKMQSIANSGRAVIFISHDMGAISKLCNKLIYLKNGQLVIAGPVKGVIKTYIGDSTKIISLKTPFNGDLIEQVKFSDIKSSAKLSKYDPNNDICINVKWSTHTKIDDLHIILAIYDSMGNRIFTLNDDDIGTTCLPGVYVSSFLIPKYLLRPGDYVCGIGAHAFQNRSWVYSDNAYRFSIMPKWDKLNPNGSLGLINVQSTNIRKSYPEMHV